MSETQWPDTDYQRGYRDGLAKQQAEIERLTRERDEARETAIDLQAELCGIARWVQALAESFARERPWLVEGER
jgi:cell division protein FtsB